MAMKKRLIFSNIKIIKDEIFTNTDEEPNNIIPVPEVENIIDNISEFLFDNISFKTLYTGKKGLGKTISLSYVKKYVENDEDVLKENINNGAPIVININCKTYSRTTEILKHIMRECGYINKSKDSTYLKFDDFYKDKKFVFVFDEVDRLVYNSDSSKSLFNIISSSRKGVKYCIILITNDLTWFEKYSKKDKDFTDKFKFYEKDILSWTPPTEKQILKILNARVKEGISGIDDYSFLEEIASYTFSVYASNIRTGIMSTLEIIKHISKKSKYDTKKIMSNMYREVIISTLKEQLTRQEIMILNILKYVQYTNDILDMYNILSDKYLSVTNTKPTLLKALDNIAGLNNIIYHTPGKSNKPSNYRLNKDISVYINDTLDSLNHLNSKDINSDSKKYINNILKNKTSKQDDKNKANREHQKKLIFLETERDEKLAIKLKNNKINNKK